MTTPQLPQLGRRAPKNAPALRLAPLFKAAVPAHPATAEWLSRATYGLYENDQYGDCGPTSVANQRRQVTAYLAGAEVDPTQDDVFDLYRRSGNPGFDPRTDADDNGVDMQTMLEAATKGGIAGKKPVAFAKVDVSNLDEVRAAISIFGSLLLGVNLTVAQQSGQTWDYVKRSPEWGGHAVLCGAYDASGFEVISWGDTYRLTNAFWTHQVEEAWAVVWEEALVSHAFVENMDLATLAADYQSLTDRPLPLPEPTPTPVPDPTPTPVPTPEPVPDNDPDSEFAGCLKSFIAKAQKWLSDRGL